MITQPDDNTKTVRSLLDARLSPPVAEVELRFLEVRGMLDEIELAAEGSRERAEALGRAVQTVRDLRSVQGNPDEEPAEAAPMSTDDRGRRWAVSRLLALEAEREPRVRAFRERHLGGGTLAWEAMAEWIKTRAEEDGPPSQYVEVVLPPEAKPVFTAAGLVVESSVPLAELLTGGSVRAKVLKYGVPGGRSVRVQAVAAAGTLDQLRTLGESLARTYGWKEDQAVVFVLTGITPYMVGIRLETEIDTEYPAASRVRLEIDPVVSPQEVLVAYSGLRQKVLEGIYRPLTEKHLQLAVFAAERRPPAKWSEVMRAWNEEHPEHAYEKETIFARDCAAAQRRLLRPKLNPDALHE